MEDRCVMCGRIIPEGRQICHICEKGEPKVESLKWISVNDRLPDCADTVIAVDRCGIMSTAYYVGYWHGGGDLDEYAVTHWMPLPQPPKGE